MHALPLSTCSFTSIPAVAGPTLKDFRPHVPTRFRFFLRPSAAAGTLCYLETPPLQAAAAGPHTMHLISPPLLALYSAGVIAIKIRFRPGGTPPLCASFEIAVTARMPDLPPGHGYAYEAVAVIQDEPTVFSLKVASIAAMGKQGDKINVYVRLEGEASPNDKPKIVDWDALAARNYAGTLELHPIFAAFLHKTPQMRDQLLVDAAKLYGSHDAEKLRLALFAII